MASNQKLLDALRACNESGAGPLLTLLYLERETLKERLVTSDAEDVHRTQGAIALIDQITTDLKA